MPSELNESMVEVLASIHVSCVNCEDCPCQGICDADPRPYSAKLCKKEILQYVKTVAMGLAAAKPE
jgi:hypothetical protein